MEIVIGSAIIALVVLMLFMLYWLKLLWNMVYWIVKHVHVVSKSDTKDPEYKRIKQTFGIQDEEEPGK